ncbi:MAG: dihydrolipoyl dehydrogenase [Verrucomicrobiota bacterium]
MREYDVIVVGGGSAGYAAARTVATSGIKVALVEGAEQTAGLCILQGCMPTKALLESAHRFHEMKRANEFGLNADELGVNWEKIVQRKNSLIRDFASYREQQQANGQFDFIRARARFIDAYTLEMTLRDSNEIEYLKSKYFIIATGSRVRAKDLPGLEEVGYITSNEALEMTTPPRSMTVLGAGPVALELAQYFSSLGVEVSVIQRSSQILSSEDEDAAKVLEDVLRREGMRVFTSTKLQSFECGHTKKEKKLIFEHNDQIKSLQSEEILYALGREPNTDGLNLEQAGVQLKAGRIVTNKTQQSSQSHIFAAGDVCGPYEIVHIAIQQGEMAGQNVLALLEANQTNPGLQEVDYRLLLSVVFTNPELAKVGKTEKQLKAEGIKYLKASYPFDDHGKSMIMGATDGFVKVLAEPGTGKILGGQIVGPHASDLIHELMTLMYFNGTVHDLASMPHYHPTVAEILTYPAEDIMEQMANVA